MGSVCARWMMMLGCAWLMMVCACKDEPSSKENAGDAPLKPTTPASVAATQAVPGPRMGEAETQPASSKADGRAAYRCDEPVFDFGTVWEGEIIEHTFIVRNDGDGPLQILAVQPTCGCLAVKQYDEAIAPGASGQIVATLDTKDRGDTQQDKRFKVTTNDPAQFAVLVGFTGTIKAPFTLDPPRGLMFGRYTKGMNLTRTVRITNNMEALMRLRLGQTQDTGVFKPTLREVEPGRVAELSVTAEPPFEDGANIAKVELTTGVPERPTLDLTCQLFVAPDIEIAPAELRIKTPLTRETRRTVIIRYNGEGEMKINTATPSRNDIKVEIDARTAGKVYKLTVTLPAGFELATGTTCAITMQTNLPESNELILPIRKLDQ